MATLRPTAGSDGRRDTRRTLRVLLVEDVEDDAALVLRELENADYAVAWARVDSAAALRDALARQSWDIVLCDYAIPGFGGPAALHLLRDAAPDLPVIVVSGQAGEAYAVEIMRAGARDYVRKDNLVRLVPAVERELRDAEVRRGHHRAAAEPRSLAALSEVVNRIAALFVRPGLEEVDAGVQEAQRAALMDVTDRKLAELALEENERRWRCLVENSLDLITVVSLDGARLYASPSHQRVYGYTDEEIGSVNAFELLHPDEREELARRFQSEMAVPGNRMELTFRYRHKDGSYRIIEAAMVSMVDDPAMRGVVINSRDVTERVRAQQAAREELERLVAERTAQLATVNQELEAFCYSISHDLRVPLRAIRGFGRELLEQHADQLDAEGRQDLERIGAAATRMNHLIEDLLSLSRVAHADLCRTRVDMSGLARAVAKDLQSLDPEREVEIVIAPEVVADGDARLLRIVIENLLNNAWKYTSHHRTARIEFGVRFDADEPEYFVRDDGAGFDAANAARLFGPFQRLHGSEFEGSGIGLATVARIIHRHGGQVRAEGAVEHGATISFTLPPA